VLRHRLAALGPSCLLPATGAACLSLGGYVLILFALRHVEVALVAALTETSIIFVALLARLWLRESLRPSQVAGMACVAMGLFALRLAP
jgi:drug/metabolite transporter (DMT)-like permease